MPNVLKRTPVTLRIVAAFAPLSPDGHPVGLAQRPYTMTGSTRVDHPVPYAILYPLWASLDGPPFGADRHADAWWTYQLSILATRGDQLEFMRDKALELLLGKAPGGGYVTDLDAGDAKIIDRELSDDTGGDEPVAGVFPSAIRFRLKATPADA